MDEPLKYNTVEEFASDDSFIHWARSETTDQDNYWNSFKTAHPEKSQLINEAKTLIEQLNFKTDKIPKNTEDEIWVKIDDSTEESGIKKSKTGSTLKYLATIAATIFLFFAYNFLFPASSQIGSDRAEKITHILPDQSIVQLNALSSIKYKEKNWKNNRSIQLAGEAFFEVKPGTNFDVQTTLGTVQVIGTSFNIYDREDQFEVSCITGMVRVINNKSGEELILSQGERIKLVNARFKKDDNGAAIGVDWLENQYHFKDATLTEVFNEMERQFDIDITLDNSISNLRYTGSFTTENLDSALYSVCWPMRITSEIKGQKIIVRKQAQ